MTRRQILIVAITTLFVIVSVIAPIPVAASVPQVPLRKIEVNARTFAFEPSILTVQSGDQVTLHFESLDAVHSLFIDGYDVNIQTEPGKSMDVTFIADKEGKFKFRCPVSCGTLHPFMIGELNVEPNFPFAILQDLTT